MTKIKMELKNYKKITGRTSRKYPKQLQTDETVYGIEVESGTMIRVVKIDKLDNNHSHLYFITKKSVRLPKDKEIYRFFLALDDRMYIDSYDFFAFDTRNLSVSQISIMEEGLCWYLMNEDTDDDEYIDLDILEEVTRKHFNLDEKVELMEYFEVEELVW